MFVPAGTAASLPITYASGPLAAPINPGQVQAIAAQALANAAQTGGGGPAGATAGPQLITMAGSPAGVAAAIVPSTNLPANVVTGPAGGVSAEAVQTDASSAPATSTMVPTAATVVGNSPGGSELWAGSMDPRKIHVTQVQSPYNPDPASGNHDCGPCSTLMALRMLRIAIPGTTASSTPQQQINAVRELTGEDNSTISTTNLDLEKAISATGAHSAEVHTIADVKASLQAHEPVILNGDPRNPGAYGFGFTAAQMVPFNGAHWIAVTGIDVKTGKFIINDPLSRVGPVTVTPAQLAAYMGSSLGIAVSR